MKSLKELYKIGNGPSSSHTMGPKRAVEAFKEEYKNANKFKVILYGSLALTGKGHLTDYIIEKTLKPYEVEIEFNTKEECKIHPNTLDIIGYKDKEEIGRWRVYSVGGGSILIDGREQVGFPEIYKLNKFDEIKTYCKEKNIELYQYVKESEGEDIEGFLKEVWDTMKKSVEKGLKQTGVIPGRLKLKRKAKELYENIIENETADLKRSRLLTSYAYAVSENNASGEEIVTAPTCGAAGVLPAVLYYFYKDVGIGEEKIIKAEGVAGIIGNIVKTNASISGAECGCQAEIGTACSMAAAASAYLMGLDIDRIENSAEVGMEHHLGLTCDPVYGYVQIPCIERNAVASLRAIDAANLSLLLNKHKNIPFDMVVETMYETGKDLSSFYRETSEGGLAKKYCRNKYYNKEMKE